MAGKLADADLRMIAEVVAEMAKRRGATFDTGAQALVFARAMEADPAFKAQLAEALAASSRGAILPCLVSFWLRSSRLSASSRKR